MIQGLYYAEDGTPTEDRKLFEELATEGRLERLDSEDYMKEFPRLCFSFRRRNMVCVKNDVVCAECDSQTGAIYDRGQVWCPGTDVKRVPRKFMDPTPGSNMRCACVLLEDTEDDSLFQEYAGCEPKSSSCYIEEGDPT